MHDVFIVDEEFDAAAKTVTDICAEIDAIMTAYLDILKGITNEGVMRGKTAKALYVFAECAEKLRNEATKLAASHQTAETSFLSQVDETDSYLY